ncbi:hypothetical protein EVG20_g4813, partial [Dentipellis fragilis]
MTSTPRSSRSNRSTHSTNSIRADPPWRLSKKRAPTSLSLIVATPEAGAPLAPAVTRLPVAKSTSELHMKRGDRTESASTSKSVSSLKIPDASCPEPAAEPAAQLSSSPTDFGPSSVAKQSSQTLIVHESDGGSSNGVRTSSHNPPDAPGADHQVPTSSTACSQPSVPGSASNTLPVSSQPPRTWFSSRSRPKTPPAAPNNSLSNGSAASAETGAQPPSAAVQSDVVPVFLGLGIEEEVTVPTSTSEGKPPSAGDSKPPDPIPSQRPVSPSSSPAPVPQPARSSWLASFGLTKSPEASKADDALASSNASAPPTESAAVSSATPTSPEAAPSNPQTPKPPALNLIPPTPERTPRRSSEASSTKAITIPTKRSWFGTPSGSLQQQQAKSLPDSKPPHTPKSPP